MKITHTELIIYGRDYSEIARHGLDLKTAKGEVREDPAHRPPRETRLRRDVLQARFAEFGDVATRFLDGLWQAQRQAPSQAALILELSGLYRRPDFVAALERAVRFGAYSLASVRRILEINARPKSALESLLDSPGEPLTSLSDISSPPRATSAYQSLLFPEPDNESPTQDERPTQDEKASSEETSTPGIEITEGSTATTGPKDDECAIADNCLRADEDPKTGEDTDSGATA